ADADRAGRGRGTGQLLRQPRAHRRGAAAGAQPGRVARPRPRGLQDRRADVAGRGHRRAARASRAADPGSRPRTAGTRRAGAVMTGFWVLDYLILAVML